MSISSLINPSGEISVQDDMWHIATSSNATQTDFKYVFDIFVNGQQLIRSKVFPEPSNNKGYFDASQVVRNEISLNWFNPASVPFLVVGQPSLSGEIAVTYQVQVGEEFSGVTTLNMASGNVTAYNYAPQLFKRRKIKISDYNNSFMTNRDKLNIRNGTLTNRIFMPVNCLINNPYPVISGYNVNGSLLLQRYYSYFLTPSGNKFIQFDVGGKNINNLLATGPRLLADDVAYYEMTFNATITDKIRIYLDCQKKYTPISLHFINAFGMFETAIFDLVSKLSLSTERKTFTKRDYTLGSTSVNYYDSNNVYNESKINYGSKTNWEYKLTMNYPTDKDWVWLQELIESPLIYAEIDDNFYPVSIKDTNYEVNQNVWGGLKALEITIEMNQTRYGYRR
jgi:hypothetical protein